jgi:hypothetical protein
LRKRPGAPGRFLFCSALLVRPGGRPGENRKILSLDLTIVRGRNTERRIGHTFPEVMVSVFDKSDR